MQFWRKEKKVHVEEVEDVEDVEDVAVEKFILKKYKIKLRLE